MDYYGLRFQHWTWWWATTDYNYYIKHRIINSAVIATREAISTSTTHWHNRRRNDLKTDLSVMTLCPRWLLYLSWFVFVFLYLITFLFATHRSCADDSQGKSAGIENNIKVKPPPRSSLIYTWRHVISHHHRRDKARGRQSVCVAQWIIFRMEYTQIHKTVTRIGGGGSKYRPQSQTHTHSVSRGDSSFFQSLIFHVKWTPTTNSHSWGS